MTEIQALGRWGQNDQEFKASLSYVMSQAWDIWDPLGRWEGRKGDRDAES